MGLFEESGFFLYLARNREVLPERQAAFAVRSLDLAEEALREGDVRAGSFYSQAELLYELARSQFSGKTPTNTTLADLFPGRRDLQQVCGLYEVYPQGIVSKDDIARKLAPLWNRL